MCLAPFLNQFKPVSGHKKINHSTCVCILNISGNILFRLYCFNSNLLLLLFILNTNKKLNIKINDDGELVSFHVNIDGSNLTK
jgi:hypothetical protein